MGHGAALSGFNFGAYGLTESPDGVGVVGYAAATSGAALGVFGLTDGPDGYAGYFTGDTLVERDLCVLGNSASQGRRASN